jgi:hypothetical protein
MSLDFDMDFILYRFVSDSSFATLLTQKDHEGNEFPIVLLSLGLQGSNLKYSEVDKQAFALLKVVKHFIPYLLISKTKVIAPYPIVRNVLV